MNPVRVRWKLILGNRRSLVDRSGGLVCFINDVCSKAGLDGDVYIMERTF